MKRTESLADLGDWPRVKIGQQSVIKHSYENALSASARLYSFATGGFPAIGGPIAGRQAILAAEDLLTFAIHSRRLFENTISTKRASQVKVPGTVTGPKEWISITRIINTLIRVAKKTDIAGQQRTATIKQIDREEKRAARNPVTPVCGHGRMLAVNAAAE